jgi:hypothetical protein
MTKTLLRLLFAHNVMLLLCLLVATIAVERIWQQSAASRLIGVLIGALLWCWLAYRMLGTTSIRDYLLKEYSPAQTANLKLTFYLISIVSVLAIIILLPM